MTGKPKNLREAIDELETDESEDSGGLRSRLEKEISQIEETLKNLKPHLEDLRDRVGDDAKKMKDRVENEISDNPWGALGIASLIFFILGFLFGFKTSRRSD